MQKQKQKEASQTEELAEEKTVETDSPTSEESEETIANEPEVEASAEEETEEDKLRAELAEAKDKYLRLYSEFENFRRRTAREKIDMIASANSSLMESLVPVLDDFERGLKAMAEDDPSREGTELIYNKFWKVLESKGLKRMETEKGDAFDDDFHEAITQIPAEEKLEGKIVDIVEKGYLIGDKVVRFAKVVTGAKS